MFDTFLHPNWEMVLFAVPFVGILMLSIFRLDEMILAPKKKVKSRRPALILNRDGEPLMSDPDGRTWTRMGSTK
jgi:hypothetical protein